MFLPAFFAHIGCKFNDLKHYVLNKIISHLKALEMRLLFLMFNNKKLASWSEIDEL